MTSIMSTSELFLQKPIQGFCHNNIGIFILTFLYTLHQNAVSTRVLLMPVNDYLNHQFFYPSFLSFLFVHWFSRLSVISLQFVKLFIVKFYRFNKVSKLAFIQFTRIGKHSDDFIPSVKPSSNETLGPFKLPSLAFFGSNNYFTS